MKCSEIRLRLRGDHRSDEVGSVESGHSVPLRQPCDTRQCPTIRLLRAVIPPKFSGIVWLVSPSRTNTQGMLGGGIGCKPLIT